MEPLVRKLPLIPLAVLMLMEILLDTNGILVMEQFRVNQ
jgi:hypothetical protein